jgi:hypothetical protein
MASVAADQALQLIVLRQARRRRFNERLIALGPMEPSLFRCECGLIACGTGLRMSALEYAHLRAEPRHFAVAAGHAIPEAERVVERHRGWEIVEKLPGVACDLAVRTDEHPRIVTA